MAAPSVSLAVSEALDFSQKELSMPTYTKRVINPENGQPVLSLNTEVNCDFLIPNLTHNICRSEVNADFTSQAEENKFCHFHNGFLAPISGIVMKTLDGIELVNITDIPRWTRLAWRAMTSLEKFLTFPRNDTDVTNTGADDYTPLSKGCGFMFHRIGAVQDYTTSAATYCAGTAPIYNGETTATGALVKSEDDHTAVSTVISASAGSGNVAFHAQRTLLMKLRLPLGMIYGTLLAVDRDLYYGQQVRLTIKFNAGKYLGFNTATSVQSVGATPTELTVCPLISNVVLKLAVETNQAIADDLRNKIMSSGVTFDIPFTHSWRTVSSSASSDSITRRLNSSHGKKCMRIITGVFNNLDAHAMYSHIYNADGAKWTAFRSYLDSKPIQDDLLSISDSSAYMYNYEKFYGSCIKSAIDWQHNAVIIDDFSGVRYTKDYVSSDHAISGIDLNRDREYTIQINSVRAAQPIYTFAQCLKTLSIGPQGVTMI
ncbi:MAG: hypothetical protein ACP5N7_05295 [Candidatus Pacearchaeota archaeon]